MRLGLAVRRGVDDSQRRAGERRAGRRVPRAAHWVVVLPVVHTPAAETGENSYSAWVDD